VPDPHRVKLGHQAPNGIAAREGSPMLARRVMKLLEV
jgi:hypothetical protein